MTLKYLCLFFIGFFLLGAASTYAQENFDDHKNFDNYSVHYALFNSTFVQPDIAAIHKLKRSKYENLINISVYKKGEPGTIPAKIEGTSRNLIQQLKVLDIIEIKEENAIYYLAPVRISGKELMHFEFNVTPQNSNKTLDVKFSKTVYSD